MQARYYEPGLARFLSIDPVTFMQTGNPSFFNRYSYAFNDPINLIDPDGRAPGDRFDTPLEAGRDAVASINGKSISENKEYIGTISRQVVRGTTSAGSATISYDKSPAKYVATEPLAGDATSGAAAPVKAKDLVGQYHTHGDYSAPDSSGNAVRIPSSVSDRSAADGYDSDNFSNDGSGVDDVSVANANAGATQKYRQTRGEKYTSVLGTPSGVTKDLEVD